MKTLPLSYTELSCCQWPLHLLCIPCTNVSDIFSETLAQKGWVSDNSVPHLFLPSLASLNRTINRCQTSFYDSNEAPRALRGHRWTDGVGNHVDAIDCLPIRNQVVFHDVRGLRFQLR